ncbi:MAG TPA: hypothetical protein EYH32_04275 [Anaerolineae bacterium]|nr:hypothetical protein [Anaerolineae bacterium]
MIDWPSPRRSLWSHHPSPAKRQRDEGHTGRVCIGLEASCCYVLASETSPIPPAPSPSVRGEKGVPAGGGRGWGENKVGFPYILP